MSNKDRKQPKNQAGKGDKRRPFNYKVFSENYENIEWRNGTTCCNCGRFFSQDQLINKPGTYISYDDGMVECKNCNFN